MGKVPDCLSRPSTSVVLAWSTRAMMAMFRICYQSMGRRAVGDPDQEIQEKGAALRSNGSNRPPDREGPVSRLPSIQVLALQPGHFRSERSGSQSAQPFEHRPQGALAVVHLQFGEDVFRVFVHRVGAHAENGADLTVRLSFRDPV